MGNMTINGSDTFCPLVVNTTSANLLTNFVASNMGTSNIAQLLFGRSNANLDSATILYTNVANGPGATNTITFRLQNSAKQLVLDGNGKLYTTNVQLDDGNGNFKARSTSTSSNYLVGQFMAPSMPVGQQVGIQVGISAANSSGHLYDSALLSFQNVARDNSISNTATLSVYGGPGVVIDGNGATTVAGLLTANGGIQYSGTLQSPSTAGVYLDGSGNVVFKSTADNTNGWLVKMSGGDYGLLVYNKTSSGGAVVRTFKTIIDDGSGAMTVAGLLTANEGLQATLGV